MKTCTKCNTEKPVSSFGMKLGNLHSWCRECLAAYARERYSSSSDLRRNAVARAKRNREKLRITFRRILKEIKASPCVDCGRSYNPWVMQFDHLHGKLFNIAHAAETGASELKLRAEIAKCELVCANCHADRTHRRRQRSNANINSNAAVTQLGRGTTSRT